MKTDIELGHVVVQEMIQSRHATRKYRLAPQRRPIGHIDLREVKNGGQLHRLWKEYIARRGRFSLVARDRKGRLRKCIAVIRVTRDQVIFKDGRCALAVILKARQKRRVPDAVI